MKNIVVINLQINVFFDIIIVTKKPIQSKSNNCNSNLYTSER